jgi:hypothetical protein
MLLVMHIGYELVMDISETMQMCNDNLRQVVAFMKEFPDYTMIQSQLQYIILSKWLIAIV